MIPRRLLTVTRPDGGARDPATAKWVPGTPKTFEIRASVQPLTPTEMQSLPEGRRTRAAYALFTDTRLQTVDEENPDRVQLGEDAYEVLSVADWQNRVLPHFRVVISKMEIQP